MIKVEACLGSSKVNWPPICLELSMQQIHQIVSTMSNSESTNSFNEHYDFLFNWQTEKKNCFRPIRSFFSFPTAQNEKICGKIKAEILQVGIFPHSIYLHDKVY